MGFIIMVITRNKAGEYSGKKRGVGGVHKMSILENAQGPGRMDKGQERQEDHR